MLTGSAAKRICAQFKENGEQPEELKRTKLWDYSIYNLEAMFALASMGQRVDVDLWRHERPWACADGQSISKALDYLCEYLDGSKKWPHRQIVGFEPREGLSPLIYRGAIEF